MAVPIDSSSEAVAATADKIFDSMGKIKILCDELNGACMASPAPPDSVKF
jgi:hypothetical protein